MPTRSNPIPRNLYDEFASYLDYAFNSDKSDGGWFQTLEDDARRFMEEHNIMGNPNDAVNQFLRRGSQ